MRISWGGWLAAASLAGSATAAHITFTNEDFTNSEVSGAAILTPPERTTQLGTIHKLFGWSAGDTPVRNVSLWYETTMIAGASFGESPSSDKTAAPPEVAQPTNTNGSGGGMVQVDMTPSKPGSSFSSRDTAVLTTQISPDGTNGNITIVDMERFVSDHNGQKMHFQINWVMDGSSYSRNFTVAPDVATAKLLFSTDASYMNPDPAFPESTGTGTVTATTSGAVPTKSSVRTGPGGTSSGDGSGSTDNSDGSSSGGHLATGAIAGIAVGAAVVGILVTGGLIWFLIRRRRRQQALADGGAGGPYGSQGHNRTQELMAEKEANAGVDVSPHSPYSDDGNGNGVAGSAAAGAAGASMSGGDGSVVAPQQAHDRTFTPYSDHQRSSLVDEPPTTTAAAASPGRSTPSAPTPYVHLVEDGMTEDDIRRLEAEERELDQAIEQAGRR